MPVNNQLERKELKTVDLFMDFTVGASGAPTLKATNSIGIKSIIRNSTGNYTIVLADRYVRCLNVCETLVSTAPAAPVMSVTSIANVNGSVTPLAPSLTVQFQTPTGTATDPASGEEILIAIQLSRSVGA
jgi:hypothetical protein